MSCRFSVRWFVYSLVAILLISAGFYYYRSYANLKRKITTNLHETSRHSGKLQLDSRNFLNKVYLFRIKPTEENLAELRNSLELVYMRLDVIEKSSGFTSGHIDLKPLITELFAKYSSVENMLYGSPSRVKGNIHGILKELHSTVGLENQVTNKADVIVQNSIEESEIMLGRQAFWILVFLIMLSLSLIAAIYFWEKKDSVSQKLKISEEKFRNIFNESVQHMILLDSKGRILEMNNSARDMSNSEAENFYGKYYWETPWWEDKPDLQKIIRKCVLEGSEGKTARFEITNTAADGSTVYMDCSVKPVCDINGKVAVLLSEGRPITEIRTAQFETLKIRNYLNNVIDSMPSLIVCVDNTGIITFWNRRAEKSTCVLRRNAIGRNVADFFDDMTISGGLLMECLATGQVTQEKKKGRHKNESIRFEDITVFPFWSDITGEIEGAVLRIDDVTDIVRMEELMIQSDKMLSVGGLAAGMAHEINNPLAGMIQGAEVIHERLSELDSPANIKAAEDENITVLQIKNFMEKRSILSLLEIIRESGERAAGIVHNMLSFSRKEGGSKSLHDLVGLIENVIDIVSADYDSRKRYDFKSIQIVRHYDEGIPSVPCEGSKIKQVLLNIFKNGADAMYEHHKDMSNARFTVRVRYEEPEKVVKIEIEDNGPGMSETVRKRIFEPFYTTKPVGKGTGLGLSISFFIITDNHGGTFDVKSKEGYGTNFIIGLPVEAGSERI